MNEGRSDRTNERMNELIKEGTNERIMNEEMN